MVDGIVKYTRKVRVVNGSKYLSIPKFFSDALSLSKDDYFSITLNDDKSMTIKREENGTRT